MRLLTLIILTLLLSSCKDETEEIMYTINGTITNSSHIPLESIKIYHNSVDYVMSDEQGNWTISALNGTSTIRPENENYTFSPAFIEVSETSSTLEFVANRILEEKEIQALNWLNAIQLENGLLESAENGNVISLYDNALAAMVFLSYGANEKAEKIFDFFNARIESELQNGVGGFSQLRDKNGVPNNHRWMGDNAWLLIALNNYKAITGKNDYDTMASGIADWLKSLQDTDGGLFAGYKSDNSLLDYKVTEGNIDAFNAIEGYTNFHSDLITFLKNDRWDAEDKNLVAWVDNPPYLYAMDLHPWSYCIFENYPVSALHSASRYLTTQIAFINNTSITGYCFDEDKDVVWLEGTGQMALAYRLAGMETEANYYLNEMEKVLVSSENINDAFGFPYASNAGTSYGDGQLWASAHTVPAISGGAWYLYAKNGFNPFHVGIKKEMPVADMFWLE